MKKQKFRVELDIVVNMPDDLDPDSMVFWKGTTTLLSEPVTGISKMVSTDKLELIYLASHGEVVTDEIDFNANNG